MSKQKPSLQSEQARIAQLNQIASKPVDWEKLLKPIAKLPPIQPLDFRKYEGMRISQAAQPIIWEVQEKLNEIIKKVNQL